MKIIVSGGISYSLHQAEIPTLLMIVSARERKHAIDYKKGVKVAAVEYKRPYPKAKHTYYVEAIKQFSIFADKNIAEIIYYDDFQVYEGAGTNIFAVIANILITSKSNIVEGITRNTLLEILHIPTPIVVRDFSFEELLKATEVFITGSNSEVRGVIEINGKLVGDGTVGEITKEVFEAVQVLSFSDTKEIIHFNLALDFYFLSLSFILS